MCDKSEQQSFTRPPWVAGWDAPRRKGFRKTRSALQVVASPLPRLIDDLFARLLHSKCEGVTYGAIGVKDRSIIEPRVILKTLSPPSRRRDLWGAGTVYGRALIYPLRFIAWGTREI